MNILLLSVIIILIIIIITLISKIYYLKISAKEIEEGLEYRLTEETNTLIDISSNDKHMCKLAASINKQLKNLREEQNKIACGNAELKNAVTNISHDLRTPITAIHGYIDLLEKNDDPESVKRYIDIIRERTEILKNLTEELFKYSILVDDEKCSDIQNVCVNDVIEETILAHYADLIKHGITPDIQISENKLFINVSKSKLSRVFSNLISNAIKYSNGDLEIILTENGKIIFSNTTTELNELLVGKLFDRFFTVNSARRSTGLGLSISKLLVEQMGGTIEAKYTSNTLSIIIVFPYSDD